MAAGYDTISFLTDYGTADEFVGVCKSVIRSISPEAAVIDISHDVAPHDVRGGGLLLARAAQYLCRGVVLGVVDPGVATDRRRVAIEVGDGQSVLVGPDNGLFAPAVALVGGATRAVELTASDYHLAAPGPTFDGRDVFAPVAAHLCTGVPLADLGEPIDPNRLVPAVLPVSESVDGVLSAEILWVDRFGNLQLNAGPDDIAGWGTALRLKSGEAIRPLVRVADFASVPAGQIGVLVDSYGMLSLAVDRGSAAAELGLGPGVVVILEAGDAGVGTSTSVDLGRRR